MDAATVLLGVIAALGGLGGVAALVKVFLVDRKQTGVEAGKAQAEIKSLGIDDQSDIIGNLRTEVSRLIQRMNDQDERITKLEARNGDLEHENFSLRTALMMMNRWASRVVSLLTPDQKAMTGDPPEVDALMTTVERA